MKKCRLCKQLVQPGQTHRCPRRNNAVVTANDQDGLGDILEDVIEVAVDVASAADNDSDDDGGDDGGGDD